VVERFVQATLRGWQQAVEQPALAVKATLAYGDQLDEAFQSEAMLAAVPLVDTGGAPIGWMEAAVWQGIHDTLLDQGIISSPVDLDLVYTNEFMEKAK
jgi:ABC-type nitrate/sulfonate/bicarbonate transport system substrate-binding protein